MNSDRTPTRPKENSGGSPGNARRAVGPKGWILLIAVCCAAMILYSLVRPLWQPRQEPKPPADPEKAAASQPQDEPVVVPNEPKSLSPAATDPPETSLPEDQPTPQARERAFREEQLAVARQLAEDFPGDAHVAFTVAAAYLDQLNTTEAVKHLEKCVQLDPRYAAAYDELGRIAMSKGDYDRAVTLFGKAQRNDPKLRGVYCRQAQALVYLGRHREAVTALDKAIAVFPKASDAHFLLGETHLQLQEYEKAKASFQAAIAIQDDHTKAYYGLATACARLGENQHSKQYRQKFKELQTADDQAGKDSRRDWDFVAQTRTSVARSHTAAGRIYRSRGRYGKAEEVWQRAAIIDPNSPECCGELASLYLHQGRHAEALELFERLTELEPDNGVTYWYLGNAYARLDRFEDAEKAYKKIIEIAPGRLEGYVSLARLYLQFSRKLPQSKTLAAKAVELKPSAANYFMLARACDKNGDRAGALSAVKRAVELDPQNAEYRAMHKRMQGRE